MPSAAHNLSLLSNRHLHVNLIASIAEFFSGEFNGRNKIRTESSPFERRDPQSELYRRVFSAVMRALGLARPELPVERTTWPRCKYVYIVKRGGRDIDLAFSQIPIWYSRGSGSAPSSRLLGASIVRLNRLPTPHQLERHSLRIESDAAKRGASRSIILSGLGNQLFPEEWKRRTLGELSAGLGEVVNCCYEYKTEHTSRRKNRDKAAQCDVLVRLTDGYRRLLELLQTPASTIDSRSGDERHLRDLSHAMAAIRCPAPGEANAHLMGNVLRAQGWGLTGQSLLVDRIHDEESRDVDETLSTRDMKLYDRCVELVRAAGNCSTSWLQRKMGLGYNRAARFVHRMERTGVVGPPVGAGRDREVIVQGEEGAHACADF